MISRVLACATACLVSHSAFAVPSLAIVHGTLIDVSDYGHGANDVSDATVIIRGGKVEAAGANIPLPKDAQIIDAHGGFIVPGLIDGYGAMRSAGFAKAYLYNGVTSVYVNVSSKFGDGEQKEKIKSDPRPGPRVLLGGVVTGYSLTGDDVDGASLAARKRDDVRLTGDQLRARVSKLAAQGDRGVFVSFDTWPDQIGTIARAARAHDMAVIGEPAFASYPEAIHEGVSAIPHNDRYETEVATASHWLEYSDGPRGKSLRDAYRDVCTTDASAPVVADYGALLAQSTTVLMPLLSIEATADGLDIPNPWTAKSAPLVDIADIDSPVDPKTGAAPYLAQLPPERRAPVRDCAFHRQTIERALHEHGARYLAGSGAPAYGILPGSGLIGELKLLRHIGLTPREALAAATGNFADTYGWKDIGRIEAGRDADVLILSADPRKDISAVERIQTMLLNGAVVDRDALLALPSKASGA